MMIKVKRILLACCLLGTIGCCRKIIPLGTIKSDSTYTNKNIEIKVTTRLLPVAIYLPQESHSITTKEDSSHLETDLAVSNAKITADGILFHDIANKQGPIIENIPVTDTVYIKQEKAESVIKERIEVPVEKPLTWSQKILITIGIAALSAVVGIILYKLIKWSKA